MIDVLEENPAEKPTHKLGLVSLKKSFYNLGAGELKTRKERKKETWNKRQGRERMIII